MKKELVISGLILFLGCSLFSCKKSEKSICDDNVICYTDAPDDLYLELKITQEGINKPVSITLYKGKLKPENKIDQFYTTNDVESYLLTPDQEYTATARYVKGQDTTLVVDNDKLGSGHYTNCDQSCYDWDESITLDLRLAD